jgi:hypothetical protein
VLDQHLKSLKKKTDEQKKKNLNKLFLFFYNNKNKKQKTKNKKQKTKSTKGFVHEGMNEWIGFSLPPELVRTIFSFTEHVRFFNGRYILLSPLVNLDFPKRLFLINDVNLQYITIIVTLPITPTKQYVLYYYKHFVQQIHCNGIALMDNHRCIFDEAINLH